MILDLFENLSPDILLFVIYAVGFALLSSFFHYRNLLKKQADDFRAFIRYFFYFFVLFFATPVLFILLFFTEPLETLKILGLQPGDSGLGILIVSIGTPVMVAASFISAKNPAIRKQYPFSKKACENPEKFILFEISYLLFYYVAWEFTFRGVLLFGLIRWQGKETTGIAIAILLQAIVATVFHMGHPSMEIFGALLGSIVFGLIAYATQSILYTIYLHALIGISNDILIYLRYHKNKQWV
jgi:membrane protease YdiL (CAAX protease family)